MQQTNKGMRPAHSSGNMTVQAYKPEARNRLFSECLEPTGDIEYMTPSTPLVQYDSLKQLSKVRDV